VKKPARFWNRFSPLGVSPGALILLLFLARGMVLRAQDSILYSYQRNFMRASLSTKAGILLDAATDDRASEFIGELYEYALVFSLQNAEVLRGDPDLNSLTVIAARGAGNSGHVPSTDSLWKVFTNFRDSHVRIAALDALAVLGKGNGQTAENLNQFLANQNSLYRSGMDVDIPTLSACIKALGALGEESSFPVLFAALIAGYPEPVGTQAISALESLPGDLTGNMTDVLRKNPPAEKLVVFRAAISSSRMDAAEKGAFAQTALEIGMEENFSADYESALTTLCGLAVRALRDLKWTAADTVVLRYFYRVQGEYQENKTGRERDRLLEIIGCLSAMNSPDAAQALSLQLGYLNSQFERTRKDGTFGENDETLVLGIIKALGEIRDKIAFDNLHYVAYLDYPENIKAAAREALNNLKW
jgi:HEAT repeat protein